MSGAMIWGRIFEEQRRVIVPLAIALVLNVIAYIAIVYPLSQRVANVAQRNQKAYSSLADARRDYSIASGTVSGKSRAAQELNTFYTKVLPSDPSAARRLTHLRLAQLAREAGLRMEHTTFESDPKRKGNLARLQITMDLTGSYPAFRTFVHQLEASPEFVVVDNVALSQDTESVAQLKVRLELSTYYRNGAS